MPNYHLLQVKYLGPTNYRGSRFKIYSGRFNQSVTLDYDQESNSALEQAERWLKSRGFKVLGHAEWVAFDFIVSSTFKGLK